MSKKYILLTSFIFTVGGGQIYCKNKSEYCNENGFDTYVFSTKRGKIEIQALKKYADLICDELFLNPHCLPENKVESTLNWILKKIDYSENDEIIIESHTPYLAVWGELLAKRINAKHIVYLLGEDFRGTEEYIVEYLKFKHKRKELACITDETMKKLFKSCCECYSLNATLGDSVEDIDISNDFYEACKDKTVVGIIGRGKKAYVFESLKKVCEFSKNHTDENFLILMVGGIDNALQKNIRKFVKDYSNVSLCFAGKLFPIPKKILSLMNVCIAGAGCVKPPYIMGVPTISVDVYDNEAIGVYGFDTTVKLKREKENNIKVIDYLDYILYGDFLEKNARINIESTDYKQEYKKHFEFIENSSKEDEFYEFNNVSLSKKDKLMCCLYKIGGVKLIKILKNQKQFLK